MEGWLNSFFKVVRKCLGFIGGTALSLMMFLTVADVILRSTGHPILGTYELVALMLGYCDWFYNSLGLIGPGACLYGNYPGEALQEKQSHDEHLHADPVHRSIHDHRI